MKGICIYVDDDGAVLIGEAPDQDDVNLSLAPVGDLDEAFDQARALLESDISEEEKQTEAEIASGYNDVRAPAGEM